MLIFGGTGFLGRHLCEKIAANGRTATVISRTPDLGFLSQHAPGFSALSLSDFLNDPDDYFRNTDTLVYAASNSIPATFQDRPWNELSANVEPAFELFARARKINPELRLVFISSGGTVYGAGNRSPIAETAPVAPISPYGYGKLALEEAIRYLGRAAGLNYAILRVSNPVGKWQSNPAQGIVNVALRAAMTGGEVTLYNGGDQIRDFMDADDLAEAILLAAARRDLSSATWNIGSGHGRRVSDIVDLVETVSARPIHRKIVHGRAVDVPYSVLDCSNARRDLNWKSETNLQDTIRSVIKSRYS